VLSVMSVDVDDGHGCQYIVYRHCLCVAQE
jgi:hypothetical protein